MRHFDLCTGIAGFTLAAHWAGMETIGFSEIDPYCCKLLEKNFPEIPNYGDIRELDGRAIAADLITAGFPCQPYSQAGRQQGQADKRDLWPEVRRVIAESQPTWFVGENTPGLIHLALERVCADLESLGYEVTPVVIPACAVDAPHRRDRVWIIAYSHRFDAQGGSGARPGVPPAEEGAGAYALAGGQSAAAADRTGEGVGELPVRKRESRQALFDADGSGEAGSHDFRLTQPPLCRRDDGLSHRVERLRALGNAIVPQVAYQILKVIKDVDDGNTETEAE